MKYLHIEKIIEVAYKLGLSEDTYQDILWRYRVRSYDYLDCRHAVRRMLYPEHYAKIDAKQKGENYENER